MPSSFRLNELQLRYDVSSLYEDAWHTYSGQQTKLFLDRYLPQGHSCSRWLLNAGAGVYQFRRPEWKEICLDLFTQPIKACDYSVGGSVERLPFRSRSLGSVICVGEVLGYCDPAMAIAEFSRVLAPGGMLICDFGSSRGFRTWFRGAHGRAADLITDFYNSLPERTWVYDPKYIKSILASAGFEITTAEGTHTWSALARRVGWSIQTALTMERHLKRLPLPKSWAELMTIAALRV